VLDLLSKITARASDLLLKVGAAGLVLMTAIVGWQVFGRYVLNSSPSWSEQASLTLMIWYVSFAAAAGVREGFHIRITALEDITPKPIKGAMRLAADLVVAACGVVMAVASAELVARTWSHVIPSLGIPRGLAYAGLPISGALIALFAIERMLEEAKGREVKEEDSHWS
jgi:TRAP-type C4-dicarboxylate transport system permease small subunit